MSEWDHVSSKLGDIQQATLSIAKEIFDAADEAGHEIWFMWGMGPSREHSTGRALDLMVKNKAAGDFIYDYVWENRVRLRLQHVIWWQSITSTVTRPGVRRQMADRGNNTNNHKDHPHILVMPGAYRPPPAKPVTAPVDESQPTTRPQTRSYVQNFQKLLGVKDDGLWGPKTDGAAMMMRNAARARLGWPRRIHASFNVRAVQEIVGTAVDGSWGPKSQAALVRWVKKFQKQLNVKADGFWGPKTDGKLILVRRKYWKKY